jgi:hypothetical protein
MFKYNSLLVASWFLIMFLNHTHPIIQIHHTLLILNVIVNILIHVILNFFKKKSSQKLKDINS